MQPPIYTINELEEMRKLIRTLIEGPTLDWQCDENGTIYSNGGASYKESERAALVEDQLRTHIINGTYLPELREAVSRQHETEREAWARIYSKHI